MRQPLQGSSLTGSRPDIILPPSITDFLSLTGWQGDGQVELRRITNIQYSNGTLGVAGLIGMAVRNIEQGLNSAGIVVGGCRVPDFGL